MSTVPLPKLLGAVVHLLEAELQQRLVAGGFADVRHAHFAVFRHMQPEGLRLTDLAERAQMTKQAAGELVTHLQGRGYLVRSADPGDGRVRIIRLTPKGHAARAFAFSAFAAIEAEWAERVGADRMAQLRATLAAIAALDGAESPTAARESTRRVAKTGR